ncbi:cytochrome P450 [Mycena epipterygia]|nr:cytochrome P450 [Mycena epipterygia]
MVLNPECQIRAQKEIDSVVGTSRLPNFEDRAELPFVECILQETLRWNPIAPLGVPHRSTQDDVYRGMSTKFMPERFLSPPLGAGEPHFSCLFGFGRRNLWIAIVSILATCTVSNALDEHGKAIVPKASMSDGVDR